MQADGTVQIPAFRIWKPSAGLLTAAAGGVPGKAYGIEAENLYITGSVALDVTALESIGAITTIFSPVQNCTRAQIVTFLRRQLGK